MIIVGTYLFPPGKYPRLCTPGDSIVLVGQGSQDLPPEKKTKTVNGECKSEKRTWDGFYEKTILGMHTTYTIYQVYFMASNGLHMM